MNPLPLCARSIVAIRGIIPHRLGAYVVTRSSVLDVRPRCRSPRVVSSWNTTVVDAEAFAVAMIAHLAAGKQAWELSPHKHLR
jgi:hypothetical protein